MLTELCVVWCWSYNTQLTKKQKQKQKPKNRRRERKEKKRGLGQIKPIANCSWLMVPFDSPLPASLTRHWTTRNPTLLFYIILFFFASNPTLISKLENDTSYLSCVFQYPVASEFWTLFKDLIILLLNPNIIVLLLLKIEIHFEIATCLWFLMIFFLTLFYVIQFENFT